MFLTSWNRFTSSIVSALLLVACACQEQGGSSGAKNAEQMVRPLSDEVVIMEFKGGKITAKDVSEMVVPQAKRFSEEMIEAYQQSAKRILVKKLIEAEAKSKGKSEQELFASVMGGGAEVSDEEVDQLLNSRPELKKALKEGYKDPNSGKVQKISRDDIKRSLGQQKAQQNQGRFIEGLMSQANVKMVLELPPVKLDTKHSPFLGGANAKVAVHEFSDFQCPYCSRAVSTVKQIKDTYGDKVKVYFRHFPLNFHEHAEPAALATICAHDQGKFWELHDKIFGNQRQFSGPGMKDNIEAGKKLLSSWAKEVGIDVAKMESCMGSSDAAKRLKEDMDAAKAAGVGGTPSFYVNGRRVQAGSFDEFKSVIDEELAKK